MTCRKTGTWVRFFYFPSGGRHAEDFYVRKIQRLRPGLNPQTWVPEASLLTTRPPKPSIVVKLKCLGVTLYVHCLSCFLNTSQSFSYSNDVYSRLVQKKILNIKYCTLILICNNQWFADRSWPTIYSGRYSVTYYCT